MGQGLVTELLEGVRGLMTSTAARPTPGGAALTRREREILTRVIAGYANKDIAYGIIQDTLVITQSADNLKLVIDRSKDGKGSSITTNPDLDTSFVLMDGAGIGITLKKR